MRRIRDLRKYGLPDNLLEIWEQQQGDFLLPVQEVAVQRYGLFDGQSLIISSPTSSGKTFVGEMAAMRATFEGKRVLYLTPLRALAEEKFQTFSDRYVAYGVKVVVATRDHHEFDRDIEQGNYHLAVLVYEKLSQLLVRHPHLLRSVALVVVDELQMLGDTERGAGLELTLVKLLSSDPRPQLLGLSAVLRESQQVADWLEADLLLQDERPVELYRGVLLDGVFRYKTYNTGEEGEERFVEKDQLVESENPSEILFATVKHLAHQEEQILIFLKGKRDTVQCALTLAETAEIPPATQALAELETFEETALKAQLQTAFAGGVAFHHADLTSEERSLVEKAYRRGDLRVIACTTTLAFGVNLPASTVFLEAVKWDTDERTGTAIEVPLTWAEYENISGRAGRLGFSREFGRSIVIAVNQFQSDLLWRGYILGEQEQFTLAPGQEGFADRVLNVIASKVCSSLDELVAFFDLTYVGFLQRQRHAPKAASQTSALTLTATVEKALDSLLQADLLHRNEDGRLEASTLGEVAARKGIKAATAVKLARFFTNARSREVPELELFHLFSLTEDGKRVYVPLSSAEHRSRVYESMMNEQLSENGDRAGEELGRLLQASMLPTTKEIRSAKLSLLLSEWIKGDALAGLESRYRCYAGTIKTLTDEISWLADAATEVAEVMGWTSAEQLKDLADCVRFGVRPEGLALARAQLPGVSRDAARALVAAGFDSPAAVQDASPEVLAAYLSPSQIEALHSA